VLYNDRPGPETLSGRLFYYSTMATASVKLKEKSKERLDRLQARLTLLGHPLTKEELLDLAVAMAAERPAEVIARLGGGSPALDEADIQKALQKVLSTSGHWGRTSWRDLDRLAYGKAKSR